MSTIQKIRNWKEYNRALIKRGEILLSFDEYFLENLYFKGKQKRGGMKIYSSQMYEYLLTLKVMLRLPWRAAVGFANGLLKKAFPATLIQIPDYAHASREAGKLSLKIKQLDLKKEEGLELAFDSTGVNVYTTSGYHQRKYGKEGLCRRKDQWKKIHVVLELNTMQILSMAYTDSRVNDCEVVKELSDQIKGKVKSIRADGAYDTQAFYKIIDKWGAQALIPPAITSKAQDELQHRPKLKEDYLRQRDSTIKIIRQYENFDEGLKEWKKSSGYHRRSLVESCMFRMKRTFGFNLQHKTERNRKNEVIAKINLLNSMAALGRAEYAN
jgi:Transposase DDE domain